jgi:hypothetical protein
MGIAVRKLASIALGVALGFCAAGFSARTEAGVAVGVSTGLPGVTVVAPPVLIPPPPAALLYAASYYYRYPRYYSPALVRSGFGYPYGYPCGFRGYAYGRHRR